MASWSERRQQWVDSREEARNNASKAAADSGEQRPPTAWPFIIAAGIVVVLLVGIFAASKFAPAEDNVTQAQLLTDAVESPSGTQILFTLHRNRPPSVEVRGPAFDCEAFYVSVHP